MHVYEISTENQVSRHWQAVGDFGTEKLSAQVTNRKVNKMLSGGINLA